jgi:hypothetical protein
VRREEVVSGGLHAVEEGPCGELWGRGWRLTACREGGESGCEGRAEGRREMSGGTDDSGWGKGRSCEKIRKTHPKK